MVEETTIEVEQESNNNNNNTRNKRKRLLKKQQQQSQIVVLSEPNNNKPSIFAEMETMSFRNVGGRGGKKNQNIKLLDNVKIQNFWGNIFQRKAEMHRHFSEAAFGSDSDKKIEYRELWKDPEYRKKYLPQDYLDSDTENELK